MTNTAHTLTHRPCDPDAGRCSCSAARGSLGVPCLIWVRRTHGGAERPGGGVPLPRDVTARARWGRRGGGNSPEDFRPQGSLVGASFLSFRVRGWWYVCTSVCTCVCMRVHSRVCGVGVCWCVIVRAHACVPALLCACACVSVCPCLVHVVLHGVHVHVCLRVY